MTTEELENVCVETVNAVGLKCPMPVIKLQQAVRKHQALEIVAIDFTDPGGLKDITSWAKVNKHQILGETLLENATRLFVQCYANR